MTPDGVKSHFLKAATSLAVACGSERPSETAEQPVSVTVREM